MHGPIERTTNAEASRRERGQVPDRDHPPSPARDPDLPEARGRTTLDAIAIALYALLTIAVIGILYVARSLLLPVIAALVIGTMLSAGIAFLSRYKVPRLVAAVALVSGACGTVALIIGLLSMQLLQWSSQLPELSLALKEKLHIFDRPIALWRDLQTAIGAAPSDGGLHLPKIEWVEPALQFLSPTLTEMLIFFVTLILFLASWPNLRRSLIMTSAERAGRLRTLRILNAIESQLGHYLLTVSVINMSLGVATGLIASLTGTPNPAALGALAATLNYIPVIGPIATFIALLVTGVITKPSLGAGLTLPLLFAAIAFLEGHFVTPTIIGRRLELNALAVFLAFTFWTWLWGPIGAFLASPVLIVGLILKEHLLPSQHTQLPDE
jgi:predicted PurR-regulated permease PerM